MPLFGGRPGGVIEAGHTWAEAAERWLDEKRYKADWRNDAQKLRWLALHFSHLPLSAITRDLVRDVVKIKAKETSPTTANRYLSLIRSVLRLACHEWDWLEAVPRFFRYRESESRTRWLTSEEALCLYRRWFESSTAHHFGTDVAANFLLAISIKPA